MFNLTEINKDDIKVGDIVGVAYEFQLGKRKYFEIESVEIKRISPKRNKFTSKTGQIFKRNTIFYVLNEEAKKETELALSVQKIVKLSHDIERWIKYNGLNNVPEKNVGKLVRIMSEVVEMLKKEQQENE